MNDQNAKRDGGKIAITLVPMEMVEAAAVVRMYGNEKYPDGGADNWKQVSVERYRDALFRHLIAYLREPYGIDRESGLPHWYHAVCNVAFITQKEMELGTIPRPEEALKKMHHPDPVTASTSHGTGEGGYLFAEELKTPGNASQRLCSLCIYRDYALNEGKCVGCFENADHPHFIQDREVIT